LVDHEVPAAQADDHVVGPEFGTVTQHLTTQVAPPDRRRTLHHRRELAGADAGLSVSEWHTAPRADGPAQDLADGVEQDDVPRLRPLRNPGAPLALDEVADLGQAGVGHQGQEHLLAVTMRLIVEQLNAGEVLEQREDRDRECAAPGHPVRLVQQACGLLTEGDDGPPEHQAGLEDVRRATGEPVGTECIPLAEEGRPAVELTDSRDVVGHGRGFLSLRPGMVWSRGPSRASGPHVGWAVRSCRDPPQRTPGCSRTGVPACDGSVTDR
jgi:hypothetical protein